MNKRPAKPTILMIDDEERILRSLSVLFKQSHQVFKTSDPEEFMQILQREHIHVIISDQRMPKRKGSDLLRDARQISPNSMRILLTGYADLDAVVASINEGEIFRYITKPWDPNELKRTVAKATEIAIKLQRRTAAKHGQAASEEIRTVPDSFSLDDLDNPDSATKTPAQVKRKATNASPAKRSVKAESTTAHKSTKDDDKQRVTKTVNGQAHPSQAHSSRAESLRTETSKSDVRKPAPSQIEHETSRERPRKATASALEQSTRQHAPQQKSRVTVETADVQTDTGLNIAKEKVLVIDDSPVMYNKIKSLFVSKYDVSFADDLESATEQLAQNDIAVAVCDTKLNGVDIAPIIKTLKQTSPELVSIVITSFQDTGMLIDLINEGQIYRCLPKPISTNMLDKSVRHAINHYHMLKSDPTEQLRHTVEVKEYKTDDKKGSSKISSFIQRLRAKLGGRSEEANG